MLKQASSKPQKVAGIVEEEAPSDFPIVGAIFGGVMYVNKPVTTASGELKKAYQGLGLDVVGGVDFRTFKPQILPRFVLEPAPLMLPAPKIAGLLPAVCPVKENPQKVAEIAEIVEVVDVLGFGRGCVVVKRFEKFGESWVTYRHPLFDMVITRKDVKA